jgi:hypothetical protein|tara:strand:- start:297 stop:437 length:141 start_codon:yes stop_codon:yes gene_type:complete
MTNHSDDGHDFITNYEYEGGAAREGARFRAVDASEPNRVLVEDFLR